MNLGALRILKLLSNGSSFGDPTLDSLPPPRFDGAMPGGGLTKDEMPSTGDPEEQRIRDLYTKSPQGVEDYKKYLSQAPTHDQFSPSLGRRIFAVLAGMGTELASKDPKLGISTSNDILDSPYNEAVKDWSLKGKGLGEVASLDERQQGNALKGEEAVQNMKDRRQRESELKDSKQQALQQKIDKANQDHLDRMDRAATNEDKLQETIRHNKETETLMGQLRDIQKENAQNRTEPGVFVTDETGKEVYKPRSQAFGQSKLTQADQTIVSSAKQIQTAITNLKQKLTPEVVSKIGIVKGNWGEIARKLGASKDKDLMDVSREMSTLELQHPKIFGLRASNATMEKVSKLFGNISQQPEGFNSALDVMYGNARDTIKSRIPNYKDPNENPDEFTITEK